VASNLVCPECGATRKVPDDARGKRFRCKECGEILPAVEESRPARKPPAAADDDALQPAPRRQPTVPARRRQEEDEDEPPRRDRGRRPPPRSSSALPLVIGGCVAGGVVLLGVVGVVAYFLLAQPAAAPQGDPGPVAFNPLPAPPEKPVVVPPPQNPPPQEPPRLDPPQRQDPLRQPPRVDPPRVDPPQRQDPLAKPPRVDPPPRVGNRVLTATLRGQITLWTVRECKAVWSLDPGAAVELALSPGRKYLAVSSGEGFDLLEVATGERRGRLAGLASNEQIRAAGAAFSPDGKELAGLFRPAGNTGGSVLVARWDLKTGKLVAQFALPSAPPTLVCSAPGKRAGVWSAAAVVAPQHVTWWGKQHLLLNHDRLLDLEHKWLVWRFQPPTRGAIADSPPDDRVWFAAGRDLTGTVFLSALPVPAEVTRAAADAANAPAALVRPGMTVSLKMDWNVDGPPSDPAGFRQKLTEGLTRWLQDHGVTVKDGQTHVLAVRVAVVDSDKKFEVRDVFGPLGRPLPGMPRGPANPDKTFQAKRLMAQVLYSDGKNAWQANHAIEPGGGTVAKDDDPATFQLNGQWAALAGWLATEPLPYFVSAGQPPATLPGLSMLTPDGVKQVPRK
jgi:hypothetical protein